MVDVIPLEFLWNPPTAPYVLEIFKLERAMIIVRSRLIFWSNLCFGLPAARFPLFCDNIQIARAKSETGQATQVVKASKQSRLEIEIEGGPFW